MKFSTATISATLFSFLLMFSGIAFAHDSEEEHGSGHSMGTKTYEEGSGSSAMDSHEGQEYQRKHEAMKGAYDEKKQHAMDKAHKVIDDGSGSKMKMPEKMAPAEIMSEGSGMKN